MSSFEPVYLYQIDQNILYVCNEQHEQRSSGLGFVNGVLVWICLGLGLDQKHNSCLWFLTSNCVEYQVLCSLLQTLYEYLG